MNLIAELKAKKEASINNIPKEKLVVMLQSTQDLKDEKLAGKALKAGDKMIDFKLPNVDGNLISLSSLLEKGKVIISFYRGGWCPYCNLELRAFQELIPQIKEAGSNFIAISPETPDNSLTTSEKNELQFEILSDINNVVAKQIGLVFKMPEALVDIYSKFGLDVAKHNGNQEYELPMPATYIVDTAGIISYAFVQEDYTERADPNEVIAALK